MSTRRQGSATSLSRYARTGSPVFTDRDKGLSFCNTFWGIGDGGVDVLFARMRGAGRTMDELRNFWKERAIIEEDYARRLVKLSKQTLGRDEIGELRRSLDIVKAETERQGGFHMNLATTIHNDIEASAAEFYARQAHHKKVIQSRIEKQFKTKEAQEAYVKKAREKYEQDCMLINSYTAQSTLVQGRDLEKIHAKLERAQRTVHTNERDFANAAHQLQATVAQWEHDWKMFCDVCQDLEEERIDFMKDNMWAYANSVSTVCVSDDESCEKVRLGLEQMETDREMESFVLDYGTGNQIPDPPVFVNYTVPDAIPSSSSEITWRPAHFSRVTHRPPPSAPSASEPAPEEEKTQSDTEPPVNTAGRGAGMNMNDHMTNGHTNNHDPSVANEGNSTSPQPQTIKAIVGGAASRSSPQPSSSQQLTQTQVPVVRRSSTRRVPPPALDPSEEPIDPTAETYIKIGSGAYRVNLDDDQRRRSVSKPTGGNLTAGSSPASGSGTHDDPLARQMEDLLKRSGTNRAGRSPQPTINGGGANLHRGRSRHGTAETQSSSPGPGSVFPSAGTSNANASTSHAPSSSMSVPANPNGPYQVRDYRNSAEAIVGVHPSASRNVSPSPSRPPSSNAPTAAFMRPPTTSPSGIESTVVQDYQQSFPGEGKAVRRLSATMAPSQSAIVDDRRTSYMGPSQSMGAPGDDFRTSYAGPSRPTSIVGHAGIGAHGGSRSTSPQPPPHAGPSRGPSPSPSARNSVGIALDPNGRVLHDDMAQRYEQQRRSSHSPAKFGPPVVQQVPPVQAQPVQQPQQKFNQASYAVPPQPAYASPQPFAAPPPLSQQSQPTYVPPPPAPAPSVPAQYQTPSQTGGFTHQQPQQQPQYGASRGGSSYGGQQQQQASYQQPASYQQSQPTGYQQPPQTYQHTQSTYQQTYQQQQQQQPAYQPPQQSYTQGSYGGYSRRQSTLNAGHTPVNRSPSPQPTRSIAPTGQTTEDGQGILFYVKALYDYQATIEEEFDFQAGDIIAVTATPEDGWWSGELLDEDRRQRGRHVFPSNFVCLF